MSVSRWQELWTALPGGSLSIVDLANKKLKTTLDAKLLGAHRLKFTPDGKGSRAFVSCTPDNDVAVIDLKTLEVTGRLDVGGRPDGLAWTVRP